MQAGASHLQELIQPGDMLMWALLEAQILEIGKLLTVDKHPDLEQTLCHQEGSLIWSRAGPVLPLLLLSAVTQTCSQTGLSGCLLLDL